MKRLHKRFLLATFCTLLTATLQAADVTITVNGRVVAKPCTIWLAQYYFVINRLSD